jgi:patatin-like phospholipase/acyl hydrolase
MIKRLLILAFIGMCIMKNNANATHLVKCFTDNGTQTDPKKTIKILAIDGGGIRGIIPIKILMEIERRLGGDYSITEYFDVMSGTSAGGIIVLMLNMPTEDGAALYNSRSIYQIYHKFAKDVFKKSVWRKMGNLWGWSGPKYSDHTLISSLNKIMGKYMLSETVKDVIIPSYNLLDKNNFMFRTNRATEHKERDFYMVDIARATSAAPTYFKPATIEDVHKVRKYVMVDGGVSANNPSLSALSYAYNQYKDSVDYFVVSIGTGTSSVPIDKSIGHGGKLGWSSNIIPLLMDSVNNVTDYEMMQLLPPSNYYRIQISIDSTHADLDDATDENIDALEHYADKFIGENGPMLDKIVEGLRND